MADVSSFDSSLPSGSSEIRKGDDYIRSMQSDIHDAWETEHFFANSSAASGGIHRPGSSRVSYIKGGKSVGDFGDEGRLGFDVAEGDLFVAGSSASTIITPKFVGARITDTDGQTINSGNTGNIDFDTADFDTDSFHSTGGSSQNIEIPSNQAGIYQINVGLDFSGAGNPDETEAVRFTVRETSEDFVISQQEFSATTFKGFAASSLNSLSDGSGIEVQIFNGGSSAVQLDIADDSTYLTVDKRN